MQPAVLYADIRCLQDPAFHRRGVGHHVAALLRARGRSRCASWQVVGLVDDGLPALPPDYAALVDDVSPARNPSTLQPRAAFLDCSPMTHDPRFALRFAANPAFLKAALVYDFIPLDWPGYLPTTASRIAYLAMAIRLRGFDWYFPLSAYTARRLAEIVGAAPSRMVVTGASVRAALYDLSRRREANRAAPPPPYCFALCGNDPRKNLETAVSAVRRLNLTRARPIPLQVVGYYRPAQKAALLRLAGHKEARGFLEFCSEVGDEALVELYAGALATICPSHIEGFSLPVAEAAVCGSPVIASACDAHRELIAQPEALFPADDPQALCERLAAVLDDGDLRERLLRAQAPLAGRFHESQVAARFWDTMADAMEDRHRSPAVLAGRKPSLAFLTPFPPDQSGVALMTQLTIQAAAAEFDIDVYTNAPRPLPLNGSGRDAGRIGRAALLKGRYDSIVSVLGNSEFHIPIFEFHEEYGGPCILHDSRLTGVTLFRMGWDGFVEYAGGLLGRPVTRAEVEVWLQERDLPSLFLERVVRKARPLIVHTRPFQALLGERYGVHAELTTFCGNLFFTEQELAEPSRQAARARLGIPPEVFLVSTFGFVDKTKGMDSCIIASEMLRAWNIPAELYFVGAASACEGEVTRLAEAYGIPGYVHMTQRFADAAAFRDYLVASDAAIQLRAYGFGQPSGALADCVSAGLPTVATDTLAEACDAPGFVRTVPSLSSPLLVAEQLAAIWESRTERAASLEARQAYHATHNYRHYVKRLREILEQS